MGTGWVSFLQAVEGAREKWDETNGKKKAPGQVALARGCPGSVKHAFLGPPLLTKGGGEWGVPYGESAGGL